MTLMRVVRLLGRLLALVLALAGIAAFAGFIAVQAAGGGLAQQALGRVWFQFDVASLNLTQAIVQRRILPALWDPVIVSVLGWPAWIALLTVAAVLFLLSTLVLILERQTR